MLRQMTKNLKSQQHHTVPRWLLQNFADREGMLHAATHDPLKFFKGKPEKLFRRRDYYAAKVIGESLEPRLTVTENSFIPHVKSLLKVARYIIDCSDPPDIRDISNHISACAQFLVHLFYRSPQWIGEDYFAGLEKMGTEMEQFGKSMSSVIQEGSKALQQNGDFTIFKAKFYHCHLQSSQYAKFYHWRLCTVCFLRYRTWSGQ